MTKKVFSNLEKVIRILTEEENLVRKEIRRNTRIDEIADLAMFPRLTCATERWEASSSLQAASTETDGLTEDSFIYLESLVTSINNQSLNLKDDLDYLKKLLSDHNIQKF